MPEPGKWAVGKAGGSRTEHALGGQIGMCDGQWFEEFVGDTLTDQFSYFASCESLAMYIQIICHALHT